MSDFVEVLATLLAEKISPLCGFDDCCCIGVTEKWDCRLDTSPHRLAREIIALPELQSLLNCNYWVYNAIPQSLYGVDTTDSYKVSVYNVLRDHLYTVHNTRSMTPAPRPGAEP